MASFRCYDSSDVIAILIMTNFPLYLIQLWWQFFPNVCLWRCSLCSNLAGIDSEKLYRATFISQYGLFCCMTLVSYYLQEFFGQMDYRRPWQKIARTPMFATVVSGGNLQHYQTTSIGVLFINYRKKVLNVNYKLYSDNTQLFKTLPWRHHQCSWLAANKVYRKVHRRREFNFSFYSNSPRWLKMVTEDKTWLTYDINAFITHPAHERLHYPIGVYDPYSLRTAAWILLLPTKTRTVKELWQGAYEYSSLSKKTRMSNHL